MAKTNTAWKKMKTTQGSYKKALSQKLFSIDGYIALTQDNETSKFKSEFKKPKTTITWPNLKLNLKIELAEAKQNSRTPGMQMKNRRSWVSLSRQK